MTNTRTAHTLKEPCEQCGEPYYKHHARTMQNYHQYKPKDKPVVDEYSYNKLLDLNNELLEALKDATKMIDVGNAGFLTRLEKLISKAEGR